MKTKELVVYSAITGGKNTINEVVHPDPKVRYICFSDSPGIKSDTWEIHSVDKDIIQRFTSHNGLVDNNRVAKKYKLQPHTIPEINSAEISLWVDGSITLKMQKISKFMRNMLIGSRFRVFKNPQRESVEEEVEYCVQNKKDRADLLLLQLMHYKKEGFPDQSGLINGSFILRETNYKKVIDFNNLWWEQILEFSKRDEVSFPYLAWLHSFDYNLFPWRSRHDCPLIHVNDHKK